MRDKNEALSLVGRAFLNINSKVTTKKWQITAAALNNKLLDLTKRTFDPADYGAKSFSELMSHLGEWVVATNTGTVLLIEWRGPKTKAELYAATMKMASKIISETNTIDALPITGNHIRDDIWQAIIDFRSKKLYVWDQSAGVAREARGNETLPVLPTISSSELSDWKTCFLEDHKETLQGADLARLLRWKEEPLGTMHLPEILQSKWRREFTRRIRTRLQAFFKEQEEQRSGDTEQSAANADIHPPIDPPHSMRMRLEPPVQKVNPLLLASCLRVGFRKLMRSY